MIRPIPILPTLIVLIAVAVMMRLGFWQLHRKAEKEDLLAKYAAASTMNSDAAWPRSPAEVDGALYRHARLTCVSASKPSAIAGQNLQGESGQAHVVDCTLADGGTARVVLGWSNNPAVTVWNGGEVTGWIGPGPRLIADPPLAGLAANARPDPANVPNNHLSYAVQWFLFALTALVIYGLALRKRLAAKDARG